MLNVEHHHRAERARSFDALFEVEIVLVELERLRQRDQLEREIAALRHTLDEVRDQLKEASDPLNGLERAEAVRVLAGVIWQRHRA